MTDRRGGPTFNIGSQQAGAIYQSGGDLTIHHGEGTLTAGVLSSVSDVRSALRAAAPTLPPAESRQAEASLDAVEAELREPVPDRTRIAGTLAQVAGVLNRAGTLAMSAEALHQLAAWLGPAGTVLQGLL